jgi:hypothetical protein
VTCQSRFYVGFDVHLMCILCALADLPLLFYVGWGQNLVFYVGGAFFYVRHIKAQGLLDLLARSTGLKDRVV